MSSVKPGNSAVVIRDKRTVMIAALRYADTFVKTDGAWLFAERRLYVDWLEQRSL